MNLVVKPNRGLSGRVRRLVDVTPESAGWMFVSFAVYQMQAGSDIADMTGHVEAAIIVLSGRCDVTVDDQQFRDCGGRDHIFAGIPAWTVYAPREARWTVRAVTDVLIAIAKSPVVGAKRIPTVVRPEDVAVELRGDGSTARTVHHLLDIDRTDVAERLLIVEVFTGPGAWSSFPPHKHDTDIPGKESRLEETYYHRILPEQGFVMQRIYDKAGLDETLAVHDGDTVLVPRGYHPVSVTPGMRSYYLNVMAGPSRSWEYQVDPDFAHLLPPGGSITGRTAT
ncbi:MAG: 5-deoxy-glucuronate isomerase [Bacilli bacterium]